jgi:uncharacterized membrane protein
MVFSITGNGHTRTLLLPVYPSFGKNSKFKLKQVYATENNSVRPDHLIRTHVPNSKGFFDLNNC